MRACAISVDLDEIPNYLKIHGVQMPDVDLNAVYDVAVPRLLKWATRAGVPLTLFAVGSDLQRPHNRVALAQAHALGHEIANHSFSHLYDLTRRDEATMRAEISRSAEAIESAVGARPRGFRAPGYTTTDALYRALEAEGVSYSSSVFPCPAYWAAKAGAVHLKRVFGKRSESIIDQVQVLSAPRQPYRVGTPYYQVGNGLLELPIQTTPKLRLPFFGTALTLGGPRVARSLARALRGQPLVNLELHGVDVLDGRDGLAQLAPHQFDLRVSVAAKLAALDATVEELRRAEFQFVSLGGAADALLRSGEVLAA